MDLKKNNIYFLFFRIQQIKYIFCIFVIPSQIYLSLFLHYVRNEKGG
jgi:hypothetical protein